MGVAEERIQYPVAYRTDRSCKTFVGSWTGDVVLITSMAYALIQWSMLRARLSTFSRYDVVSYMSKALERLINFRRDSWERLIDSYIDQPPHSPITEGLAFLGYVLFGHYAWVPYPAIFTVHPEFASVQIDRFFRGFGIKALVRGGRQWWPCVDCKSEAEGSVERAFLPNPVLHRVC